MFKLTNRITLVALCILSLNAQANAPQQSVEGCSELLQEGHKYEVSITANVDKTADIPSFTGELSVTGGNDEVTRFDISKFVECIGPLIKEIDKTVK